MMKRGFTFTLNVGSSFRPEGHKESMPDYSANRRHGSITNYSGAVQSGVLTCDANKIYLFSKDEWLSDMPPISGLKVSFIASQNWAKSVIPLLREPAK